MSNSTVPIKHFSIPLFFAFAKIVFHLFTNTNWGFHRDELLYLALGQNPDWGFWSIPPLTGWLSWLGQNILGNGQGSIRIIPMLMSMATVVLCIFMAKEMGGKRRAQILAGVASISSLAYLRSGHMFQPVATDIFFWTLATYLLARFLRSEKETWLLWLGVAIGFGFLNKYSVLFLVAALGIGLLLTPARNIFLKKKTWMAAGLTLLIISPNIWWQWTNNFPVVFHLTELADNQLSTIKPVNFLLDQLLMHLWSALIWLPGLFLLLRGKRVEKFRPLGWFAVATVSLFLIMSGKAYYTLGMFPVLMAAGGIFWENQIKKQWKFWSLAIGVFLGNMFLLPASVPIFSIDKSVAYFKELDIESMTRWERGNIESLPQDYADMLGWEEIAHLADEAVERTEGPEKCLVYCENYGQAGAVQRFGKYPERVTSFSDNYRLWMPHKLTPEVNTLIYINDELGEDIVELFENIEEIGKVETPHARERGTTVYLCQNARRPFAQAWSNRVQEIVNYFKLK